MVVAENKASEKFSYWGTPIPREILLGMWSTHLWTNQFATLQANNMIALTDYGLFIGTFTNSYGHRSYSAGINRYWLSKAIAPYTTLQLGYRLGAIYGYLKDEVPLFSRSPVIPFAQLLVDVNWRRVGFELSTTGEVISGGFYIRF